MQISVMKDFVLVYMDTDTVYLLCLPESDLRDCLEQADAVVSSNNRIRTVVVDRLLISGNNGCRILTLYPQNGKLTLDQAVIGTASREINNIALGILEAIPSVRAASPITDFEMAELQQA